MTGDPWAVYERLSQRDGSRLTPDERRLVALAAARAEVNNGGLHQYFVNSSGDLVIDAIDAARCAGVPKLEALLRRAVEILDLEDPGDRSRRQDRLIDHMDDEAFSALDEAYYALEVEVDLDQAMARLAAACEVDPGSPVTHSRR
ncbi:DMP19 family protein [Lapillicoccus jejuensis]|uniref:Uncharacterized protein DUF4375 n=1 Tax=Lapillicoccus jejuensis TaxID=402171 RepID=A0A542E5P3_9MICO|nr:DUF4375 domain-containing protein [Lapillicoccus jejuensis]TQJ10658.1 uncharacterized protein DUF4375 [Lapillicoccus jejuensis]